MIAGMDPEPSGCAGLAIERETALAYQECAPGLSRYAGLLAPDKGSAQDALQEAFLRYFLARREGKHIGNTRAWLFRVVRNCALDSARAAGARGEVALTAMATACDRTSDPESVLRLTDFERRARLLLAPRELQCVLLRGEGLGYDEIAEALEIRRGTVGALLSRAHKKIRLLRESVQGSRRPPDAGEAVQAC